MAKLQQFSSKTTQEIGDLLGSERTRNRGTRGDQTTYRPGPDDIGGYIAKVTTEITAASDSGGVRTVGEGVADLYMIDEANNHLVDMPDFADQTVYNMTTQTGAVGSWIQVKITVQNHLIWDVTDCT